MPQALSLWLSLSPLLSALLRRYVEFRVSGQRRRFGQIYSNSVTLTFITPRSDQFYWRQFYWRLGYWFVYVISLSSSTKCRAQLNLFVWLLRKPKMKLKTELTRSCLLNFRPIYILSKGSFSVPIFSTLWSHLIPINKRILKEIYKYYNLLSQVEL